ncbi:MAG: tetratricopeptide repeat protein [Proteobacteria bacterium]|nr:tetratricopeptide repeat protein [Pseudomonadota bacterium]
MRFNKKLYIFLLIIFCACSFPKIIVVEDKFTAEEHNDLGVAYLKQKKYDLAEKEFLRAIKKKPKWDIPYYNLGNNYYSLGDYCKAESYYRKAIKINEKNSDAMNNLAYILFEQCRFDEAEEIIKKAISIHAKEEYLDTQRKIQERKCIK